jgi:hypothetical protein
MRGGNLIDKTFDTLAEARVFRNLTLANAALDPNEQKTFEARAKKVENKSFTLGDAIEKYRKDKSEKLRLHTRGARMGHSCTCRDRVCRCLQAARRARRAIHLVE